MPGTVTKDETNMGLFSWLFGKNKKEEKNQTPPKMHLPEVKRKHDILKGITTPKVRTPPVNIRKTGAFAEELPDVIEEVVDTAVDIAVLNEMARNTSYEPEPDPAPTVHIDHTPVKSAPDTSIGSGYDHGSSYDSGGSSYDSGGGDCGGGCDGGCDGGGGGD